LLQRLHKSGQPKLLLTAAVGVGKATADEAYDIPAMNQHLDLISLMTYDMHGTWESITGFNAPLRATAEDIAAYGGEVSVEWAVNYWLDRGASPDKLVLGFGTYGRGWTLANPAQNSPLSATNGPCNPGTSTKDYNGYLAYYEIVAKLEDGSATRFYDADREVPYLITDEGEWIGYDDVQSFTAKLNFLKTKNLRGAMHWAIDLDDMTTYPMLNTIKNGLVGYRSDVSVVASEPTVSITTSNPGGDSSTSMPTASISDFPSVSVGDSTVSAPTVSDSTTGEDDDEDDLFESGSGSIYATISTMLIIALVLF